MTVPNTTITRSTAGPRLNALAVEGILAFVGTSTEGDVATPIVLRTKDAPADDFGIGMMPEAAGIDIDYSRQIALGVRTATATVGAYGTIDVTGKLGTAIATTDPATVPDLDGEAYVVIVDGGIVGAAGVTFKTSPAADRNLSSLTALGTGTSIAIPQLGAAIVVAPAGLFALVDECVDDYLAHIADAVSHTPADTANTVSTAPVTTLAEVYAKASAIKIAAGAHVANTGGTYHDVADTVVAGAAITALVVPTTPATAITFWNAFKGIFNTHRTQATIHPVNDTTNVVVGADATAGTLLAGDIIRVTTTAPKWDATSLAAALASLNTFNGESFGAVVVLGAITSNDEFAVLRTALANLRSAYKPVHVIAHTRLPNSGESESTYEAAMTTLQATWEDNRITVVSGGCRYIPGDISLEAYEYTRSPIAPIAARWARTDPAVSIAYVKEQLPEKSGPAQIGGRLAGAAIYDASNQPIGHDEYANPGLDDVRFTVLRTHPLRGGAAYVNIPRTMAAPGDRLYHASAARIVNMVERVIYFETSDLLQLDAIVDPDTYFLAPASRNQINGIVRGAIRAALGRRLSNIDVDEIFVLADNDNLNPDPPAVPEVNASCVLKTPQWIVKFNITLSVNP